MSKDLKDSMGRFRTQSLFFEMKHPGIDPVFTLKPQDHEVKGVVYKSLRRIYLDIADPTEYDFAIKVFDSWEQWRRIFTNGLLSPYVNKWREELELKLRAGAINTIQAVASDPYNKGSLTAARWLADRGWDKKRGRPSKDEVAKERKIVANIHDELDEDYDRIIGKPH